MGDPSAAGRRADVAASTWPQHSLRRPRGARRLFIFTWLKEGGLTTKHGNLIVDIDVFVIYIYIYIDIHITNLT